MATVNPPQRPTFSDTDRRVRHPLQAVRGYIRSYVTFEGLGTAILYLAIWFWVGVALDWGSFYLFAFDWVQELQYVVSQRGADFWLRLAIVLILAGGLVLLVLGRVVIRLLREFSDVAVALVLERRFPRELGDRLITAVELADPKLADKYGFSPELVQKTIDEAAERVEKVPVQDVFDWGRLRLLYWRAAVATLGVLFVVGCFFVGYQTSRDRPASPFDFLWKFYDVSSIWFERNILLMDTYWPRQAYLEVIRFQDTPEHPGEMRVGLKEKRPDVTVRAIEWVVSDRSVPGGWRALAWKDLPRFLDQGDLDVVKIPRDWPGWQVDVDYLDVSVPAGVIPPSWQDKSAGDIRKELTKPAIQNLVQNAKIEKQVEDLLNWQTWTMDQLEQQLARPGIRAQLREEHTVSVSALDVIYGRLEELAGSPSQSRSLRKLEIPKTVRVYNSGKTTRNEASAEHKPNHKYHVGLNELKESVRFTVRGLDYYTPYKEITLVPPPALKSLTIDKEEPAYLYYRLQGDQSPLKGKRQQFKDVNVLGSGEQSVLQVPLGTSLVLRGEIEEKRRLSGPVRVLAPDQFTEAGALVPDGKVTVDAERKFALEVPKIAKNYEFILDFNDQDKVKGQRKVLIRPFIDEAPEVLDVDLEVVLRKPRYKADAKSMASSMPDGYLITPDAFLPIKANIRDQFGLSKVDWMVEVEPADFELIGQFQSENQKPKLQTLKGNARVRRLALVASGLQNLNPDALALTSYSYWSWVGRVMLVDLALQGGDSGEKAIPVETFAKLRQIRSDEEIPAAILDAKLKEKPKELDSLRRVAWKDGEGFDVRDHLKHLKSKSPTSPQLHYLIRLALQATDNNIETGPNSTRNKNPFTFLVVSENELLSQIALEEETLSDRLDRAYDLLAKSKTTLDDQIKKLSDADLKLDIISLRVDEARKSAIEASNITREVHGAYSRIALEAEKNRLNLEYILKVQNQIVTPLQTLLYARDMREPDYQVLDDFFQKSFDQLEADAGQPKLKFDSVRADRVKTLTQTRDKVTDVMNKVNDVLKNIQQIITLNKQLELAIELEQKNRRIANEADRLRKIEIERLLEGLLK